MMDEYEMSEEDDERVRQAVDFIMQCFEEGEGVGTPTFDAAVWFLVAQGLMEQGVPEERIEKMQAGIDVATVFGMDDPTEFRLEVTPSPLIGRPFVLTDTPTPGMLSRFKVATAYSSLLRVSGGPSNTLVVDARNLTDEEDSQWWTLREEMDTPGLWRIECDHDHDDEEEIDSEDREPPCTVQVALHRIATFVTFGLAMLAEEEGT